MQLGARSKVRGPWMVIGVSVGFLLACAGGPSTVRVDYSHVDGGTCMMTVRSASLASDWDLSGCASRADGRDGLSDSCAAATNAECCDQIGATMMGWEVHRVGNQTYASPVCKL